MPRHGIHLGTAWEPPSESSPVWERRFGRPAGLETGDRLLLVCEHVVSPAPWRTALLNGLSLEWRDAGPDMLESDVSGMVGARNHLVVPAIVDEAVEERGSGSRASLPTAWGRLSLVVVSD